MTCRQVSTYGGLIGEGASSGVGYATEADCLNACKEGACCYGTTCSVKPQCQCQGAGQTFKGVGTTCNGSRCPCAGENFLCQAPGCRPRFVTVSIQAQFPQGVVQYNRDYIRFPAVTFAGTITLDNQRGITQYRAPDSHVYVGRFYGADAATLNASETRIGFYPYESYALVSLFRKIESLSLIANDPCFRYTGIGAYYDVTATSTNTSADGSGADYINYVAFAYFGNTLGFSDTGHCYGTGGSTFASVFPGDFNLTALARPCEERASNPIVSPQSGVISNSVTMTFIDSYV